MEANEKRDEKDETAGKAIVNGPRGYRERASRWMDGRKEGQDQDIDDEERARRRMGAEGWQRWRWCDGGGGGGDGGGGGVPKKGGSSVNHRVTRL